MMKFFRNLFFGEARVCPWWLAWTFDNPLRRFFHEPELIVGPYLHEGMKVADIGCGMGYFSVAMAAMVGDNGIVIAVDLQQEMLDILRTRAERGGVTNRICPLRATEDNIGIKEPIDFILCFWMVHEVKDIPRFFREVYSILKEGGKVLYVEPRIHVSKRRFQEILGHARAAGFRVDDAPQIRLSRAVLFKKDVILEKVSEYR